MLGMNEHDIDYSVALSWTFDSTPREPRNPLRTGASVNSPEDQPEPARKASARDKANPSETDLRWQRIVAGILDVIARFPDAYEAVRIFYGGPLPEPAG